MTDTIDVAALVERGDKSRLWLLNSRLPGHELAALGVASTIYDLTTALQSQADALAANETELDLLRKRVDGLLTAEASLATMRESLEEIERTDVVARYRGFGTTPDQYEVGPCAVIARAALAALAKEGK